MISRAGRPDTEADVQLRAFLDATKPTSFVMNAGAGSGKTTSLVKALDYIAKTHGERLKRQAQKVACITYTKIAEKEVLADVGEAPLFHVSTIHSFLWTVIRPFQKDIRNWVVGRIGQKIEEAKAKLNNPRTRSKTRERLQQNIERLKAQQTEMSNASPSRFTYGTGSDYQHGVLGHDDIIKMVPALICHHPLLQSLVAQRFPFVFVDESQDTVTDFVDALKAVQAHAPGGFCLGFFGDPMQKIYTTGVGPIKSEHGWSTIEKPENFRCPATVLALINKIRQDGDGRVQTGGRTEERDGVVRQVDGTARLFIAPADDFRSERLQQIRRWLATKNHDPGWLNDAKEAGVRILMIVHRMAAKRLGFAELYAAFNDNKAPSSLRDGFPDGTSWAVTPFLSYLLPLAQASREGRHFDLMNLLRQHCPVLAKDKLLGADHAQVLQGLKRHVDCLVTLLAPSETASIVDVLRFVRAEKLAILDDRLSEALTEFDASGQEGGGAETEEEEAEPSDEENPRASQAMAAFFRVPAKQMWAYRTYVNDESAFSTQHGIKGAEFKRVLTILDDDEGTHQQYSYNKYLKLVALSATDRKKVAEGADNVLDRTRRLFYVCCSRAVQDLAVVLFFSDVELARKKVVESGLFPEGQVHVLTGDVQQ